MIDRKIPPPIKDAIEYKLDLKPYEFYSLDNNVPVYSINAGEQDVLQVEMVFYAGNFFEEQKGIAAATNLASLLPKPIATAESSSGRHLLRSFPEAAS